MIANSCRTSRSPVRRNDAIASLIHADCRLLAGEKTEAEDKIKTVSDDQAWQFGLQIKCAWQRSNGFKYLQVARQEAGPGSAQGTSELLRKNTWQLSLFPTLTTYHNHA